MNKDLHDKMDLNETAAKELKIHVVAILLVVFIILMTLRWQFLAQPMFFEFAFTN